MTKTSDAIRPSKNLVRTQAAGLQRGEELGFPGVLRYKSTSQLGTGVHAWGPSSWVEVEGLQVQGQPDLVANTRPDRATK